MSGPHLQDLRRAIIRPEFDNRSLDRAVGSIQTAYSQLAQEVINVHNRFYVDQIAVPGATGLMAVVLPTPYPDTSYSPLGIPDWNAHAYVTAIATTGFTLTFSAASPGGGGVLRLIVIR